MVLPSKFDTSKGLIEIYAEKSESGKKTKDEMQTDQEYEIKLGARRFEEIMNRHRTEPTDLF